MGSYPPKDSDGIKKIELMGSVNKNKRTRNILSKKASLDRFSSDHSNKGLASETDEYQQMLNDNRMQPHESQNNFH